MMEGGSTWVQNIDARANKEVSNGRTSIWNPASKDGSHSLINRKFGAWPPTDGVFTVCFTWYPLSPITTWSRCPAIHVYIPLGSTGPYASLAVGTISRIFQEHRKILPTKCKMIIGECKRLNVQQHSTCQKWVHKQVSNSQSKPHIIIFWQVSRSGFTPCPWDPSRRHQGQPAAKVAKGKGDAKVGFDADWDGQVSVYCAGWTAYLSVFLYVPTLGFFSMRDHEGGHI